MRWASVVCSRAAVMGSTSGVDLGADGRIGAGQIGETLRERLVVQHRAANDERQLAACADGVDQCVGIGGELRGGIRVERIDDVDQVMGRDGLLFAAGLGGADVHAAIHQRGIHADDFDGPALGQLQRGGGFSRCGGPKQADGAWRGDRRRGHHKLTGHAGTGGPGQPQ